MRILFAIKSMANAGGGTERVVSVLAPRLRSRGHDVRLVTLDRVEATSFYELPADLPWTKLATADIGEKLTLCASLRTIRRLRRLVRAERPDIAVGFMHSMYVPLAAALVGNGVPMIASEHIVPDYYRRRRLEYALLTLACCRARKVTALSQAIADRYPAPVRRRMIAIPNPVSPTAPVKPVTRGQHETRTILTIGRMDGQKDHQTLIRAFARIAPEFPDWQVRIVGDGELRGDLEALVQDLGLGEQVSMPGTVKDTTREYLQADLFALPSRFESFGMVVAEALGHGLPVVAFADCPGVNEILSDETTGLLVDGTDRPTALARALHRLVSDPALRTRLGSMGPSSVAHFQPDRIAERWETILRETAQGARAHQ